MAYFVHQLAGDRKDLDPYISNNSIVLCLSDKTVIGEQQEILDQLIDEGEAIGHSYVNRRYTVPFSVPFPNDFLSAIGFVISYNIWLRGAGGPTESYQNAYKSKMAWLKSIATGEASIDGVPETVTPSDGGLLIGSVNTKQLTLDILQGM